MGAHGQPPENLELWSRYQPTGARVEDLTRWAVEVLLRYRPELAAGLDLELPARPRRPGYET
jgi:hypothetical protein